MENEFIDCNECKGRGLILAAPGTSPPNLRWVYCSKCKGVGRLTWLENMFKKTRLTPEERKLKELNVQKYLNGEYR